MTNPIHEFSAKAMGAMKAVKAGFNGLRGVFLHLAEEHGEVASLMGHLRSDQNTAVRSEYWPRIRAELLSHERAELAEVYSLLSRSELTRELSATHNLEAGQLEVAIAAVDAQPFSGPNWGAAFEHVFALVQQHVATEETEFFPRAQEVISEEESKIILGRYETAKKAAKNLL